MYWLDSSDHELFKNVHYYACEATIGWFLKQLLLLQWCWIRQNTSSTDTLASVLAILNFLGYLPLHKKMFAQVIYSQWLENMKSTKFNDHKRALCISNFTCQRIKVFSLAWFPSIARDENKFCIAEIKCYIAISLLNEVFLKPLYI